MSINPRKTRNRSYNSSPVNRVTEYHEEPPRSSSTGSHLRQTDRTKYQDDSRYTSANQNNRYSTSPRTYKQGTNRFPRPNRTSGRRKRNNAKFIIHIEKVLNGVETRTTLMIRNIPNKYTREMILSDINVNCKKKYDFFYLPIDFKNKCNVGYAFINFISHESVPKFYEEFNERRWDKFNSEKVCQITYGRIQGKSALIEHFQNSSLLQEDPSCQPLIFHSSGDQKGEIQPFPTRSR
eukprot:TRINITY_DN9258_c0_g1_i1.p1 TRINITY_DN9258_c0_g1~~TRINITY_DN9258_c0_g1_i1.p1  ORF type:complete len:237 (+),score=30.30 TRINITY_DN9258_c0_g1_i1:728-1438(+)